MGKATNLNWFTRISSINSDNNRTVHHLNLTPRLKTQLEENAARLQGGLGFPMGMEQRCLKKPKFRSEVILFFHISNLRNGWFIHLFGGFNYELVD